ncbi:MAG: hypothetical protein ACRDQ7_02650 [Haloechinothrix sp.]
MGTDATRTLAEQITGPLPAGIAALDAKDQQALAGALASTCRQQAAELIDAAEAALKYVPALLRGTVRKAVGL